MITPTSSVAGSTPAGTSSFTNGAASSGDFQTFLTMLTTQMQNQNPLEPIEASDFAAQLATFSGVEQQVQTNQLLSQLTQRMGLAELGSWVGRDVLSPAPILFDGSPITLVPPEVAGATDAELVVTDQNGAEVGRYPVDPQSTDIVFEVPDDSDALQEGELYQFTMVSYEGDTELARNPVLGYAQVREARVDAGQVLLVLDGGQIIASTQVVGLRGSDVLGRDA